MPSMSSVGTWQDLFLTFGETVSPLLSPHLLDNIPSHPSGGPVDLTGSQFMAEWSLLARTFAGDKRL